MVIELIVIGKTDSKEVASLVEIYARRVNFYCKFAVTALPDIRNTKNLSVKQQRTAEGEAILRQLSDGDYVVLLDERGDEMRSVEFACWLQKRMNSGVKRLVLVIGGPYGFSEEVYKRSDARLSLSRMTFSHQIVRAISTTNPITTSKPMERRPAIAVAAPNVLMGVGMKSILEKIIPAADVELFGDFESFTEADPERFFHFFVAAQLFVTHGSFFRARRSKTILLCSGQPQPAYADMHCIDVCTNEEAIVRDILRMHHGAHRSEHIVPGAVRPEAAPLSGREAEVLALIARGYMNKQIADSLQIGLTTVISHRRNIMEKLGIRSVAGLAIYALTAGYVDAGEL